MTTKRRTTRATDLHKRKGNANEWSSEPVAIEVRPSRMDLVSFRLPSSELEALQETAAGAGESLSQFIRNAIAMRTGKQQRETVIEVSSGTGTMTIEASKTTTLRQNWATVQPLFNNPQAPATDIDDASGGLTSSTR